MILKIIILTILISTQNLFAKHEHHHHTNLNGLSPVRVMGDHTHHKGGFMLSYRYMEMNMSGITNGDSTISEDDFFSETTYMMAPKSMNTKMHMLGAMYGVSDKYSLMLMLPQVEKNMAMIKKMGRTEIKSSSKGIGDISLNLLSNISSCTKHRLVLLTGLSLPTGSINEEDNGSKLGYKMQPGTGSYGLNLALTYTKMLEGWSWGSQLFTKLYLNENSNDYTRGNIYKMNAWIAKAFSMHLEASVGIEQKHIDPIKSNEDSLSSMSAAFNPKAQHGVRRSVYVSSSMTAFKGHRFSLEYSLPIDYKLADYQLNQKSMLKLAWQKAY